MRRRSGLKVAGGLIFLVSSMMHIMCVAILLGVIGNLASIFITILGGELFIQIFDGNLNSFVWMAVLIVVLALSRGFLRYGEQACNHFIAFKILAMVRDIVFAKLRELAPAKLDGKDKGNLISMITSDVEQLEVFYAHTISPVAIAILVSLIMLIYIGQFHYSLAIIALLGYICVGFVLPMITSKMVNQPGLIYRTKFGELNSHVLESISGIKIVDQYEGKEVRLKEMEEKTLTLNKYNKTLKDAEGISLANSEISILLFSLIMFVCAYYLYTQNLVSMHGVLLSTIAMMSSFGPVNALSSLANNLASTLASGERVLSLLEETPNLKENTNGVSEEFTSLDVENVSFAYEEEIVLDNLSIHLDMNKIYGIKGKSGSGKSTLLKLIMHFYKPDQGCIKMNGISLEKWNSASLRKNISYVAQDTYIFDDSMYNNILVGNPNATKEEVIEACKKANLHDFILSLPQGYESKIGSLSNALSGGERQRVGLARAFLHQGKLMLLDEPTSNLDSLNEAILMKALKENAQDKTILIVSHRDSSLKICDEIITFESSRKS